MERCVARLYIDDSGIQTKFYGHDPGDQANLLSAFLNLKLLTDIK